MTDPSNADTTRGDHGASVGVPMWKYALYLCVAIAVVAVVVILHTVGGIGPGSH